MDYNKETFNKSKLGISKYSDCPKYLAIFETVILAYTHQWQKQNTGVECILPRLWVSYLNSGIFSRAWILSTKGNSDINWK
jgi:hypothetical protein